MTTPPGTGDPAAEIQRLLDSLTAHVAEDEAAARTDLDAPDDAQRYSDNDQWGEPLAWLMDADRVLREAEAKRALIAAIMAEPHDYIPGDEFYSCSQAVDPDEDDPAERYPGSGCSNEDRAGEPCDCGRDARVLRVLRILAGVYETLEESRG